MAMIVAYEWYREHGMQKAAKLARDYARDAAEADAAEAADEVLLRVEGRLPRRFSWLADYRQNAIEKDCTF
jgi:hypothetical protein